MLFVTGEDNKEEVVRRMLLLDPDRAARGAPLHILPIVEQPKIDPEIVGRDSRREKVMRDWLSCLRPRPSCFRRRQSLVSVRPAA